MVYDSMWINSRKLKLFYNDKKQISGWLPGEMVAGERRKGGTTNGHKENVWVLWICSLLKLC